MLGLSEAPKLPQMPFGAGLYFDAFLLSGC